MAPRDVVGVADDLVKGRRNRPSRRRRPGAGPVAGTGRLSIPSAMIAAIAGVSRTSARSPHPIVKGAVLRAVEHLDQVALVGFAADLADAAPKAEEALDRGSARIGRDGLDPIRRRLRPSARRPRSRRRPSSRSTGRTCPWRRPRRARCRRPTSPRRPVRRRRRSPPRPTRDDGASRRARRLCASAARAPVLKMTDGQSV